MFPLLLLSGRLLGPRLLTSRTLATSTTSRLGTSLTFSNLLSGITSTSSFVLTSSIAIIGGVIYFILN